MQFLANVPQIYNIFITTLLEAGLRSGKHQFSKIVSEIDVIIFIIGVGLALWLLKKRLYLAFFKISFTDFENL